LLPEQFRGEYADQVAAEPVHLEFLPSAAGTA